MAHSVNVNFQAVEVHRPGVAGVKAKMSADLSVQKKEEMHRKDNHQDLS